MKWFSRLNKPPPAGSNKLMKKASAHFMKNTKWVGLVTALAFPLLSGYGQTPGAPVPGAAEQAPAAAPVNLSPGAAEVVRLAGSGVGDDVVLAYIQNSRAPFNLAADDVLYLKDIGLSPQVTSAMLSHDTTLRTQSQQYAPAAPAPAVQPGNAPLTHDWQSPPAPTSPAPAIPAAPVAAPPSAYVTSAPADVGYFYNDLSPYGTWVSLEGYGWCWQPRTVVVSHGWRPYCDGGHWVYTDAGWFWQSDYSWGWAPFHYGRWYQHPRCGWVWTPDRVWGPAWVTWRASGDVCGWAPLPPRAEFDMRLGWRFNGVSVGANFDFGLGVNAFAFVAFGDFCNRDLGHRRLSPERVTTIYRQTTIINNYEVHNNTIVHRGIPIERVTAASRVPVPRATVRDLPAGSARVASRTASVVYRPQLQAPARPVNMMAQKVDAGHPVIQHAPIAPARMERPSTVTRSGSAPVAAPRRPAVEAPKASPWSSGARPSSSPQYQPTPRSSQSAPAPATPKASPWSSGAKPSSSSQYQPTPRASQPVPASATPQASAWSSGAKPAASPQSQRTASAYPPVLSVPPGPTSPQAPSEWKQGARPAPGYRSDAGLPSIYNARAAAQQSSAAVQTPAPVQNSHVYAPKSARQAAEIRSMPSSDQRPSASPSSAGKSSDSKSGRKQ
jgi:hypothetical protein